MPPALSDDENSSEVEFTTPPREVVHDTRPKRKSTSAEQPDIKDAPSNDVAAEDGEDEDEEDEDEDDEEDVMFVVEAIKNHLIDQEGTLKFQVKWEGYESKKDLTWEPEENLEESASEVLEEYFAKIGGRRKVFEEMEKARTKKRRRTTNGEKEKAGGSGKRSKNTHPADTTPPATAKQWNPPAGSWEDEIEMIDACEIEGSGKLIVYLIWKNGSKTKHDTSVIYKKCPQKMLQFYERHVKIIRDVNQALTDEMEA